MNEVPVDLDVLIKVTDSETAYVVRNHEGRGQFEEWQRGSLNEIVVGSTVAVALRFLTFQLAHLARPTWWPLINPSEYAPETRLQDDDEGNQRLRWDDAGCTIRAGGPRNGLRASSAGWCAPIRRRSRRATSNSVVHRCSTLT